LTAVLELRLLGPFQINGATPGIPQRAKGLIAYLAMHAGRSVSREALANLLWSYSASQQARQSLRQCLTDVRAALGPAKDSLEATRAAIRFTQSANTDIDIRRFEALAHRQSRMTSQRRASFIAANFSRGSTSIQNRFQSG